MSEAAPRLSRRLLVRLYLIGIVTMLAVGATMIGTRVARERSRRPVLARSTLLVAGATPMMADVLAGRAPSNDPALETFLRRLQREAEISLTLYARDGHLVTSNVQPPLPPMNPQDPRIAGTEIVMRGPFTFITPIRSGNRPVGYAVARAQPPPHRRELAVDVPIALAWIGLAAWSLSRTISRPLRRIAAAARAFGNGDLSVRSGVDRRDEIGDVARAFDEMSERIAKLLEAERELLAGVSHELRTPLSRIRVALDLAEEGDAETARLSLRDVAADLTEIETLIDDIFSTARLEIASYDGPPEAVPLRRSTVELESLVGKAVSRMRDRAPERPFDVEIEPSARGGRVHGDPIWLRRALENVLENAHKYSPPKVSVTVTLARAGDGFSIRVVDRGFGISPIDRPRVFRPFFRADRSRARSTGGVGLGLALAKRVIEAHGGRIELASELDVGTTVTFTLPSA